MATAGIIAQFSPGRAWAVRFICGLLAVAFLVGMGIAIWHAGAEWKFWPGPAACALNRQAVSAADLAAVLSGAVQHHAPSCEEAAWRMFGISMAGYNAVISLGLAVLSGLAAMRKFKR
jgi:disulfide bond formation protein DsbB